MLPEPELNDLYRDIILDHYRQPRNRGKLPEAGLSGEGYNPLCGDEVTLRLIVENGKVRQVMFEGRGCSISQASTSMMTEIIKGKTIDEVREMIELFKAMMTKDQPAAPELGDLEALEGVRKFPVRIKCATLAWNVLQDLINRQKRERVNG